MLGGVPMGMVGLAAAALSVPLDWHLFADVTLEETLAKGQSSDR